MIRLTKAEYRAFMRAIELATITTIMRIRWYGSGVRNKAWKVWEGRQTGQLHSEGGGRECLYTNFFSSAEIHLGSFGTSDAFVCSALLWEDENFFSV